MKVHCSADCDTNDGFWYKTALTREQVTCKICKRSDEYKKLPSQKQVKIYNPKRIKK